MCSARFLHYLINLCAAFCSVRVGKLLMRLCVAKTFPPDSDVTITLFYVGDVHHRMQAGRLASSWELHPICISSFCHRCSVSVPNQRQKMKQKPPQFSEPVNHQPPTGERETSGVHESETFLSNWIKSARLESKLKALTKYRHNENHLNLMPLNNCSEFQLKHHPSAIGFRFATWRWKEEFFHCGLDENVSVMAIFFGDARQQWLNVLNSWILILDEAVFSIEGVFVILILDGCS